MGRFRFRPSARLQKYLGQELIADPNLAVLEFVKNAYDAGAENVFVDFLLQQSPSTLRISDDGTGMTEQEFERNWMHPGYSEKPGKRRTTSQEPSRVPTGEKGLGRLAAGRLGERLDVFTRRSQRARWLHVAFPWSEFEDMNRLLDEVVIVFDYDTEPSDPRISTGTIVEIGGLTQKWDGRVRGRPIPGRSRTRLGRLKQDLRLLVRPLAPSDKPFAVHLDSDSFLYEADLGLVTPQAAVDDADYVFEFDFRPGARGGSIRRRLYRSDRVVAEFGGDSRIRFPTVRVEDVAEEEARPASIDCGAFTGRFLYTPPPAARRAKEVDAVGSGVLLYRDGVLVEPYGMDDDDWVGVAARKAQRQGYALVQPATFSGYVLISRETNPDLRDMSNRLGLLDNEASEGFGAHVRAEFRVFERLVSDDLQRRWESIEEKAARQSEESIDLAAIRLRAIAHSLGQPLLGLAADASSLRDQAADPSLEESMRNSLLELAASSEAHIKQAQRALQRFRDVPATERTLVEARDLIAPAIRNGRPLAQSLGVNLVGRTIPRREVLVHAELVTEAIKELVRNAIEATSLVPDGRVEVSSHEANGDFVLDIVDQGGGIPSAVEGSDLAPIASSKGRTGEGIQTVLEIVRASRGRVVVARSDSSGTHIEVFLPDRLRGLREIAD